MQDGYGSPYIRCYFGGQEIPYPIENFKYTYAEDDDDNAEINIRLDDRKAPDLKMFQEGAIWTMVWGWIKGPNSHIRTVVSYEVKWQFDSDIMLITIMFHEQGVSLKQRAVKDLHQGGNIVSALHEIGKVHGLKTSIVVPDETGKDKEIPTTDSLSLACQQLAQFKAKMDSAEIAKFNGSKDNNIFQLFVLTGNAVSPTRDPNLTSKFVSEFTFNTGLPQANKTDKMFLDELAKKQPGGQFILDTTDDKAVLRKRNFGQKPRRLYTWAGGDGELQSFQPESKGTGKDGTSINLQVDGWDKMNKTYFAGDSNVGNEAVLDEEAQKTLAKYRKQRADLDNKVENYIIGNFQTTIKQSVAADATRNNKLISLPITVLDKKTSLDNTIDYFTNGGKNKPLNDPTIQDPNSALAAAANARQEAELKNNPGYFEAIGDPSLEKGMIVTILGVSKKYSGNYYITHIEHSISGDKEYMIRADIVRQGHNIQTNNSFVSADQTAAELNKYIGDPNPPPKTTTSVLYNAKDKTAKVKHKTIGTGKHKN